MSSARLPFDESPDTIDDRIVARDRDARARAVDPRYDVALEASAGTGKTRVLVDRYVNLLRAGVDPVNILAITFTRKAAAEMRDRIMATLRAAAARGEIPAARWRSLRDRTSDIAISTIDAPSLMIPSCRGSWTRPWTARCAFAERWLVTTSMWHWYLRSLGNGAPVLRWRRCSNDGWWRQTCCSATWPAAVRTPTAPW